MAISRKMLASAGLLVFLFGLCALVACGSGSGGVAEESCDYEGTDETDAAMEVAVVFFCVILSLAVSWLRGRRESSPINRNVHVPRSDHDRRGRTTPLYVTQA
eukprot:TRINITY_DN45121_c0_g1_i1.p2 TRINITY_DN45121_c0_g1~~TRINITY_DN45121_c0_g1_i1.p2  ORF type:complete len:103 (-),score=16.66 TRINITY_DN45121_c0_g1_i1:521-829(-)